MAKVLSIESQAKSLGVVIFALLLGVAVDWTLETYHFVLVAVGGILVSLMALLCPTLVRRPISDHSTV